MNARLPAPASPRALAVLLLTSYLATPLAMADGLRTQPFASADPATVQTRVLSGESWDNVLPTMGGGVGVYDPVGRQVLVLPANWPVVGALFMGTYPAWHWLPATGTPPSYASEAVYDPVQRRVLAFGDSAVWQLSLDPALEWAPVVTTGPAMPRRGAATCVLDEISRRLIVCGQPYGGGVMEVWALPLDGTLEWEQLSPLGIPPVPRGLHTAVFASSPARMILYGGSNASGPLADVWELSLESTPEWHQILPSGASPLDAPTTARSWTRYTTGCSCSAVGPPTTRCRRPCCRSRWTRTLPGRRSRPPAAARGSSSTIWCSIP